MALQFQPPPDWLLKEYIDSKNRNPVTEGLSAALPVAQMYLQQKQLGKTNELAQRQADIQKQLLILQQEKGAREQDTHLREYNPAGLPGAGGAYNKYSTQDMGEAQGPALTGDAQLRSLLTQSGGQATLGANMGPAQPQQNELMQTSPVIDHWNSGFGMNQNTSLAKAPQNPQEEANLQFANKYPQGFAGAKAEKRTSLDEQFTPEEIAQILQGKPLPRPMSARGLGRVQQAIGQAGTQGRFETKLDQGIKEKGAAAGMKVGDTLKQIKEARGVLSDLATRHAELAPTWAAGSPAEAGAGRLVGAVTGGAGVTAKTRAYDSVAKGMAGRMKTLTGNVGMLTEFDQGRLENLIPQLGESTATVKEKNAMMNRIFDLAESGEYEKLDKYLRTIGVKTENATWDSDGNGVKTTGMEGLSDEELQRIIDGE